MKCPECQRATAGMIANQAADTLRKAIRARHRPIGTDDDVVELSGRALDALLTRLADLSNEGTERCPRTT